MKKAAAITAVVVLLSMSACGSDDTGKDATGDTASLTGQEKEAATAIAKSFTERADGTMNEKEADCFATRFVSTVGLDKLRDIKLITAEGELNQDGVTFDEELSGKFADSYLGCVDYQARQAAEIAKTAEDVNEDKLRDCLEDKMPDSFVRKLMVAMQVQSKDSAELGKQSTAFLTDCKKRATEK